MGGAPIIVTGLKEGIVVPALKLETSLQDFRWHINERSGKVGNETCRKRC
jgi:hypothetical protein